MANVILTPVTLWKDFNDTLPLKREKLSEKIEETYLVREVTFLGREAPDGRVKIYARYYRPLNKETCPAVMILFEAGCPLDETFALRFVKMGYAVLCPDYCGDGCWEKHTEYPKSIDYANYQRVGRHMDYAEPTAKETSWYEWAAVARYAAKYLSLKKDITGFGAIGLRTGGEILFKVAPYAPFKCFVSVCAAGWLAYRGKEKFSGGVLTFDEERHRFIAGIDSQSYAPHVKCPVLLLSAINDPKYNYDRIYDTFQQISPSVEKAILFSAHGNGLIGGHSLINLDLFLSKYLKNREIFVSEPVALSVGEDEEGRLVAKAAFDPGGKIVECGIFYTEKIKGYQTRDWTRVLGRSEDIVDNVCTLPIDVYTGSQKVLVYAFVRYSNDFSLTSKIQEVTIEKPYTNACPKSRVLYTASDGLNGFVAYRRREKSIADCFTDGSSADLHLTPGYGGILGVTAKAGILSYRVSEPRYAPDPSAVLRFDAYSVHGAVLKVSCFRGETEEFSCRVTVQGGGKWKDVILDAGEFKSEKGITLSDFTEASALLIVFEGEAVVNNVLWL